MCVILILGWKNILDQVIKPVYNPPVVHFMFNVPIFISFLFIEKEHLASFLLYETRGEIHKGFSLLMLQAPFSSSQGFRLESLVFNNRSIRSSTCFTSEMESIPCLAPPHTVVTLITTSRLAAALIRGSLGLS